MFKLKTFYNIGNLFFVRMPVSGTFYHLLLVGSRYPLPVRLGNILKDLCAG